MLLWYSKGSVRFPRWCPPLLLLQYHIIVPYLDQLMTIVELDFKFIMHQYIVHRSSLVFNRPMLYSTSGIRQGLGNNVYFTIKLFKIKLRNIILNWQSKGGKTEWKPDNLVLSKFNRLSGVVVHSLPSVQTAGGTEFKSRSHHKRYSVLICSCSLIDRRVEWLCHSNLTFALVRQPRGSLSRMYE